jgi:hypothetical protein
MRKKGKTSCTTKGRKKDARKEIAKGENEESVKWSKGG